jgi:hypothetical protein
VALFGAAAPSSLDGFVRRNGFLVYSMALFGAKTLGGLLRKSSVFKAWTRLALFGAVGVGDKLGSFGQPSTSHEIGFVWLELP